MQIFRATRIVAMSFVMTIILSSCGGDTSGGVNPTSYNVALASRGGLVTSNIDTGGTETYVNDGDTSTANSWQASTNDDYLVIEFSTVMDIESIAVVASGFTDYPEFSMEISTDGSTYSTTLNNQTDCTSYSLTASGYGCEFTAPQSARSLRFTILDNTSTPQIHEIVIMGMAPLA